MCGPRGALGGVAKPSCSDARRAPSTGSGRRHPCASGRGSPAPFQPNRQPPCPSDGLGEGVMPRCAAWCRHERAMPRRRPGQLRRAQLSALPSAGRALVACFPGVSPHGVTLLIRFELRRRGPGTTGQALQLWAAVLNDPHHRLYDPRYEGRGFWECCTDPWEVRSYLEAAAHVLPRCDARRFRAMLAQMDERW